MSKYIKYIMLLHLMALQPENSCSCSKSVDI